MFRLFHRVKVVSPFIIGLIWPFLSAAQAHFPTPPNTAQRLFYVQRTHNTNTIIYDANTISNGRSFDTKQPINVYWIRYAENGQQEPLSYLQRTMAYGVDVRRAGQVGEFDFNVVSYPKRKLRLYIDPAGKPHAVSAINGKSSWLNRVYIHMEGKKVGIIPDVKYVELFGTDPGTGKAVYEKFVP